MAGYCGYSMSNNAVAAYDEGKKPISKWKKEEILCLIEEMIEEDALELNCSFEKLRRLPAPVLKDECLSCTEWHHTGKFYKETDFYELDEGKIEQLTDEQIDELAAQYKEQQEWIKKEKEEEKEEKWECIFLEWYGTRKHPKAREIREIGRIKGDWFYRDNGSKKKISARGFTKLRRIMEDDVKNISENK